MKEDQLFSLVNSLSRTEKSYFKKIKAAFGSKESTLIKIFDHIQSGDEYDEKQLIKKIKFSGTSNSFSVKKNSLYNGIIDILSLSKSSHKDVLWQINRLINHGIILKEKRLFKSAKQTFQKAYKMAKENEFFYKQIEVNQQLIEIFRKTQALTDFNALKELEELRTDILSVSKQLTNNEEYYLLADQLHLKTQLVTHTSEKEILKELQVIYDHELLQHEANALSQTALACFHYIHYLKYYGASNETDKALFHLEKIISIQEKLLRFPLRSRFVQMGNYVHLAISNERSKKASQMLSRMGDIYKNTTDYFIQIFHCVHLDYFHIYQKSKTDYFIFHESMESEWDEMIKNVPFNMEVMDLKYAQFRYEFLKGNFKKAFSISNFIDQQHNIHSFKNGKLNVKLLKTLAAFELDDFDLMSSEIRSIKHLLKSTEFPLESELEVFKMLKELLKNNTKEEERLILNNFISKLSAIKENDGSFTVNGLKIKLWAEAKINKVLFSDLFFK